MTSSLIRLVGTVGSIDGNEFQSFGDAIENECIFLCSLGDV